MNGEALCAEGCSWLRAAHGRAVNGDSQKSGKSGKITERGEEAEPWAGAKHILLRKNKYLCWMAFRDAAIKLVLPSEACNRSSRLLQHYSWG